MEIQAKNANFFDNENECYFEIEWFMAMRVDSWDSNFIALWSNFIERNEQKKNYTSGSVIFMIVFMAYRAFLTAYCSCRWNIPSFDSFSSFHLLSLNSLVSIPECIYFHKFCWENLLRWYYWSVLHCTHRWSILFWLFCFISFEIEKKNEL